MRHRPPWDHRPPWEGHPHHWEHPWQDDWKRAGGVGRIGWYLRARLRRRMFAWFGLTIVTTALVVMSLSSVLGVGGGSWHKEVDRGRALLGHTFEQVWDRPDERERFARTLAKDGEMDVTLIDAAHHTLLEVGARCERPDFRAPVRRDGQPAGEVLLCMSRARQHSASRGIIILIVAASVIWGMSGRVARRLANPYDQLVGFADELGRGNFAARITLGRRERHGEAAVLARVLNDMAARIEKQMADQRELLAAVSHEIRTPLARIRILTELARDGGDAQKSMDEVDREVVEIDALVGELLASARLDFSAIKPSPVDVRDAAQRALVRAGLGDEALAIEGDVATVQADPTLLARALSNLLENAKRHAGGAEKLVVARDGANVTFEVQDRGPGIPAGDEEKIFERFYRANDTVESQGSLGLGLALVQRIAQAHGGRAYAKNRPGGGAIVGVSLPV